MGLLGDVSTLRKLGNFAAALFPGLDRAWVAAETVVRDRASAGWPARAWTRFRSTRTGETFAAIVSRFYWGSYRKDRVDWTRLPQEGASLLRAGFVIALLLCLSIPLAAAPWARSVSLAGDQGRMCWWSAALVMVSLAAGRALLLAGAATANRFVLCFVACLDLYVGFGLATCGEAKATWLAMLVPLPALLAAAWSERALSQPGRRDRVSGAAAALVVGGAAGAVAGMLFPPLAGLGVGKVVVGATVGFALALLGGVLGRRKADRGAGGPGLAGWLLLIELGASAIAVARSGMGAAAARDMDLANLASGFLWPLWYFAGVGIIFKLLGSAKTLASAIRDTLPGKRLTVLTFAVLLGSTALLWMPALLDVPGAGLPGWLTRAAEGAYVLGRRAIWLHTDHAMAAELVRWIVAGALLWALVQVLRRRFDTAQAFSLLLIVLLGTLGCYEYVVQQLGFLRSGPHTVTALTGFGIWLLWMLQKTGQQLGTGSSPRWPASARLALFGGILVLVMAQVHARGARLDPAFSNEVFLLLYKAFIDVGIPYALFVWAGRSLPALPASTTSLVIAFSSGALLTVPMHALGRLDACGWSLTRLSSLISERGAALLQGNMEPMFTDPGPSWTWIGLRAALLFALVGLAGARLQRRRGAPAAVLILMAASAGFGSFSRALLDLPVLSPRWIALVAPLRQTFELDAHVVGSYVVFTLPVLVAAWLAVARKRWWLGAIAGVLVHVVGARLWPGEDAWLRSTGVLWTLGLASVSWLVALGAWAHRLADPEVSPRPRWQLAALVGVPSVLLASLAGWQAWSGRMEARATDAMQEALYVPVWWQTVKAPPGTGAAFRRESMTPVRPTVLASIVERPAGGAREALEQVLEPMRTGLPEFELSKPDHGGATMVVQGAVVAGFTFETTLPDGTQVPVAGSALARDSGTHTLVLLWMGPIGDRERQRWDLARMAQQFGDARL